MQHTALKSFASLCLLFSSAACTPQEDADNSAVSTSTRESENTEQVANDNAILPATLNQYLAVEMPDWRLIAETEWLMPDFLEFYAESSDKSIVYKTSVFTEADLNGDEYPDYAAFLIDGDRQTALWAFHGNSDNSFESYQLLEAGVIDDCCVGQGLEKVAPDSFTDLDSGEPNSIADPNRGDLTVVEVPHDSIAASIYGKSSTLYYFDGTAYQAILTSD
ncbi:MAG: hypothetical protein WBB82_05755 [Limnothrix sp.]